MLLVVASLLWPSASAAQAPPLSVEITDCSSTSGNVQFTNTTGTAIDVRLVTGALRGFKDPVSPGSCPDDSYWEQRYPSVHTQFLSGDFRQLESGSLQIPAESSLDRPLSEFLPDNFGTTAPRRASDCTASILSVAVLYGDVSTGAEAVASCKAPAAGFSKPTISSQALEASIREDFVLTNAIHPRRNIGPGLGFEVGTCQPSSPSSAMMIQNRSVDRAYQGVWAGRFACKRRNDVAVGDLNDGPEPADKSVCFTPFGTFPTDNEGQGIRARIRGFRMEPDDCAGMSSNAGAVELPACCACTEAGCPSPVALQCSRAVVAGVMLPGEAVFKFLEPFVFIKPGMDLEPRTKADATSPDGGILPRAETLAISCNGFALSDLAGFGEKNVDPGGTVYGPFNEDRFDFDYGTPNNAENVECETREWQQIGRVLDRDQNGVDDNCQNINVVSFDASEDRSVVVRRIVRNTFYDGTASGSTPPPAFLDFDEVDFSGTVFPRSDGVIDGDPSQLSRYGSTYSVGTPGGVTIPGPEQTLRFDPDATSERAVLPSPYFASELLFAGVRGDALTSRLAGFDLFANRRADLLVEKRNLGPAPSWALRGIDVSPKGDVVYTASGPAIFTYETDCAVWTSSGADQSLGGRCTTDPDVGRSIGTTLPGGGTVNAQAFGVAVEPDDEFAYVIGADPEIVPGAGRFAIVERADHSIFADPNGVTLFSSIPGTPIDIEVSNFGPEGARTATAYVTSVVLEPGESPPGGGGGAACGFDTCHEFLPRGGMMRSPELGVEGTMSPSGSGTYHRRMLLSAYDLDRPNFSGADVQGLRVVLSSTDGLAVEGVEDFGLDVAADGRIFVVSPDTNELKVVPADTATGALLVSSMQTLGLGWRPTDVAVAPGPIPPGGGDPPEVAVVVGTDPATLQGKVRIYRDTENLADLINVPDLGVNSDPVSVSIKQDGTIAYVAAQGQAAVLRIDLANGLLLPTTLPVSGLGTLRKVAAQRVAPGRDAQNRAEPERRRNRGSCDPQPESGRRWCGDQALELAPGGRSRTRDGVVEDSVPGTRGLSPRHQ